MTERRRPRMRGRVMAIGVCVIAFAIAAGMRQLPMLGAGGLLHPSRRPVTLAAPPTCSLHAVAATDGLTLRGWQCHTTLPRRGTIVYLHGIADNRASARGVIDRFGARGFDVVAYDHRGHGDSDGDMCTYGFHEKRDVQRILDTLPAGPVVLIGTSLGAAIAIQAAAIDGRITAVVAAEIFADLETVVRERAPFVFTDASIREAVRIANARGHFEVAGVSPERSAASLTIPVLLVHGADDVDTRPDHSRRVLAQLKGAKRLILVPGAGHNASLGTSAWREVEAWLDEVLPPS